MFGELDIAEDVPRADIESTAKVLRFLSERENDSDHVSTLVCAFSYMCEEYGRAIWPNEEDPDLGDVTATIDTLELLNPSAEFQEQYYEDTGKRAPGRVCGYALEMVMNEYEYVNGSLPNPPNGPVDA